MKLHCLGTAGYHPNETRHTSCYAIPDAHLVLDAGSGFFRIGPLIRTDTLHVLLSHSHLDHVFGLTFVYDFFPTTPLKHVHIYAQRDKIHALKQHLFHELIFPILPPFHWHPLEDLGRSFEIDGTQINWFELEHPGGSVGYNLQLKGTSFAYITDTTSKPDAPYWKEIQGVDWLLHECNFSDRYRELAIRTGHSWASAVLESASKAHISRLLLSHFNPLEEGADPIGLAEAKLNRRDGSIEEIVLARDGLIVDLD